MKRTIIVLSSNRDVEPTTRQAINNAIRLGAVYIEQRGSADVAQARNIALTSVCHALRAAPTCDVVLMTDDDMVWNLDDAAMLVDLARVHACGVSGLYGTAIKTMAARRPPKGMTLKRPWLTGLGLLAVPASMLLELEQKSETYTRDGTELTRATLLTHQIKAFTWTGCTCGVWLSEDYRFCQRLGGVRVAPRAIGHIKKLPLYPDEDSVKEFAAVEA